MGTLEGKVALVTGAGRGIGRGIARLLAREGAAVVVNDLGTSLDGAGVDTGPAATVVREIEAAGGRAVANTESVADFQAAERMVRQAVETFGKLDHLVNVAGILRDPENVAPLVAFLASDAARDVTGHLFGSFGYNIALMSQPKVVKTLRADHRPTVEELCELIPRAFGPELESITDESGFSGKIEA